MPTYPLLIALIAVILFYSAWHEKTADNPRDAKLLVLCGVLTGALAAFVGLAP